MPLHLELPVVKAEAYGKDYVCISIRNAGLAALCLPGNFCQLKAKGKGQERRLYKPISVYKVLDDEVSFLVKRVGIGSEALCALKQSDVLLVTGTLGNSFPVQQYGRIILVSGGVGYPPLAYLKSKMPCSASTIHIHGGASGGDVFPCDVPFTIDGSAGAKGLVSDGLETYLQSDRADLICSCGPVPMLKAVHGIADRYNVPHLVSMEAYMACGIGVCHGCSIPYAQCGQYARVCHDGPVFDAYQIRWEEL